MTRASCMGGWCLQRERCARHMTHDRRVPIERLCEHDQLDAFVRISSSQPVAAVRAAHQPDPDSSSEEPALA